MKNKTDSFLQTDKVCYYYIAAAIVAAFILTLVSLAHLCSENCAQAHNWRFFGLSFEMAGLLFFPLAGLLHLMTPSYPKLLTVNGLLFFSALGAEYYFVYLQKVEIGAYCPICLAIGSVVLLGTIGFLWGWIKEINRKNQEQRDRIMKGIKRAFSSLSVLIMGWALAFAGVAKYDPLEAIENSVKNQIAMGNVNSAIEVYLFTDWACPACRRLEPVMKNILDSATPIAAFFFVDHPIHPETLNFIPFNLSFLINEKPKYLKMRDMLTEISIKTGKPTEALIAKSSAKLGVEYQELDYSQIAMGSELFQTLGEKFKIRGTPTMIIVNTETHKGKKLTGSDEITPANIKLTITQLAAEK